MGKKIITCKRSLKVLIIAPYPIVPPETGAKIRVYELAYGVSQHGVQVTVVIPISPVQWSQKKINQNLTIAVAPYPFIIPFLFTNIPFSYMYLISLHPGFHLFLRKFFRSFDIIQFEQASFGDLVNFIPLHKTVVYDAHNVESDYVNSEHRRQWMRNITTNRIHKLESKLAHRADRILTCSTGDTQRIAQLYDIRDNKFAVIPNGIHLHKKTPCLTVEQIHKKFPKLLNFSNRAIFSGSDAEHNRAAVRFLIKSVAPQLRETCAFIIKGQCGNNFKNHHGKNVFFDLTPSNVGPYADICTVAVNPIMQGSGTSLKVLDFLAHGLPVVSTEFGMRGYEDLKKYVTLSDTDNFADTLRKKHQFLSETYSAIEKYSWQSITRNLKSTYNNLINIL